jgi:hypothetical protein
MEVIRTAGIMNKYVVKFQFNNTSERGQEEEGISLACATCRSETSHEEGN